MHDPRLTSFWPSQALLTSPGHPTLLLHLSIALLHLKEFAMARTHMEYMLGMGNHPLYKTEFKEAHSPPWHLLLCNSVYPPLSAHEPLSS